MMRQYIDHGLYMEEQGARMHLLTANANIWMTPETALVVARKMAQWAEEVIREYPLAAKPRISAEQCAQAIRDCTEELRLDNDEHEVAHSDPVMGFDEEHRLADDRERARDITETRTRYE